MGNRVANNTREIVQDGAENADLSTTKGIPKGHPEVPQESQDYALRSPNVERNKICQLLVMCHFSVSNPSSQIPAQELLLYRKNFMFMVGTLNSQW